MPRSRAPTPDDFSLWKVLGENLRARRRTLERSIEDVAIGAGLSRNYLSEIETGTKPPTLMTLRALAAELDVKVWELLRPQ